MKNGLYSVTDTNSPFSEHQDFPLELFWEIIAYLNLKELSQASQVSSLWNQLVNNPKLWEAMLIKYFSYSFSPKLQYLCKATDNFQQAVQEQCQHLHEVDTKYWKIGMNHVLEILSGEKNIDDMSISDDAIKDDLGILTLANGHSSSRPISTNAIYSLVKKKLYSGLDYILHLMKEQINHEEIILIVRNAVRFAFRRTDPQEIFSLSSTRVFRLLLEVLYPRSESSENFLCSTDKNELDSIEFAQNMLSEMQAVLNKYSQFTEFNLTEEERTTIDDLSIRLSLQLWVRGNDKAKKLKELSKSKEEEYLVMYDNAYKQSTSPAPDDDEKQEYNSVFSCTLF